MGARNVVFGLLVLLAGTTVFGSEKTKSVYVEEGVLRWPSGEEVALFGVNYNAPFAFTYRAIDRLSGDHEAAIVMDVNHLKRLGVDAYRIHLWDRELSDKDGNLLENEHLRLFDFLLAELKKQDIKIIVTTIAWWGSGYPEPDPDEPGFAAQYTKPEMNQKRAAIEAQKRYITQLLNHKNPYTNTIYKSDPDIIAIELFNEPKHQGAPAESAAYIEELVDVARATGLNKPVFYNIAEQGDQQEFAAAVCDTSIDGIGYQWYPTGLVHYSTLQGNMLPTVQRYTDVFADTESCDKKARMIYEFDAADVANSVMYPAMARSFREAGFQWATLFSYDPAVTAHTNAEYNTHYLNLLYTPKKAISFLIAGEVFSKMPRSEQAVPYPENNSFLDVTLDHHQNLSVLNSARKFYYSNNTELQPKNPQSLQHIAGVGSSPVVKYDGSGAYFLDRLESGAWQLEVYPDLQKLEDPRANSSLRREVGRLYRSERSFSVQLPGLPKDFYIQDVNAADHRARAKDGRFEVGPGIYVLSSKKVDAAKLYGGDLPRFILPEALSATATVWHQPRRAIKVDDDLKISARVGAKNAPEAVELLVRYKGENTFFKLPMQPGDGGWFHADLADAEGVNRLGPVEYAIVVSESGGQVTFPGGAKGSPKDWDFVKASEYWTTVLKPAGAPVTLFDAEEDRNNVIYPQKATVEQTYVAGKDGQGVALRLKVEGLEGQGQTPLSHLSLAKDSALPKSKLQQYDTVILQIRSLGKTESVNFGVLDEHGLAYVTVLEVGEQWRRVSVPLSALQRSSTILPQAYPMFMPGALKPDEQKLWPENARLNRIQGLQFSLANAAYNSDERLGQHGIEIGEVTLVQAQ